MTDMQGAIGLFHGGYYLAHNAARLSHLAGLGLPLQGRTVLEPGAGIGDHTLFYLARGCSVTAVEPRPENCAAFRINVAEAAPEAGDRWRLIEGDVSDTEALDGRFDIVHCYGLLYHLSTPDLVLRTIAARCEDLFLLETCVSFGDQPFLNPVAEPVENPSQAVDGIGCRPTRPWVFAELSRWFPHVYATVKQPAHVEFPTDWSSPEKHAGPLARAVFVGARRPIDLPGLTRHLPERQERMVD